MSQYVGVDAIIVVLFLISNLVAGIYSGRGIKNIKEYAIGNRNFSTATLTATIIATAVDGGFFSIAVSETYRSGLWYVVTGLGDAVSLLIIGLIFAPYIQKFFDKLSVAEIMGDAYGQNLRVITALASIGYSVGMVAFQIKMFSAIFSHFLGFSSAYATFISSFVVIVYSAFGGIKSVTFTDVIQFITFGVFIPIFVFFIWKAFGSVESISHTLKTNPAFDIRALANYSDPKFLPSLSLFLYCAIPSLCPAMFHRTLMARSTKQVRTSFSIAALVCVFIYLFNCFIGLVVLSHDGSIDANHVAMYVVDNYAFTGLKGLAIIGIMAMIMSTADSWVNTASVIFAHDLCKPLNLKIRNELLISRIFAIFIGLGAVFLALSATNLLSLMLLIANFFEPIITPSLMLLVLGFTTSNRAVYSGMICGIVTVLYWRSYVQPFIEIDSVLPGLVANFIGLLLVHYVLKEPGGWHRESNNMIDRPKEYVSKKKSIISRIADIRGAFLNFSLINYCNSNIPRTDATYLYFGFSVLATIITTLSLDHQIYHYHISLISAIQGVTLLIGTTFICYKLWSDTIKKKYSGIIWYVSIFIVCAFISSFLVLLSKFAQISLVIFIINLTMIGMLLTWQISLVMIIVGILSAFYSYQAYIGELMYEEIYDLKLKIVYSMFMISAFLIGFLKPNQEAKEKSQMQNQDLSSQVLRHEEELKKLLDLKNEFIRNINHEIRTPMTGIVSLAQTLSENYGMLTERQRIDAINDIKNSGDRLFGFMSKILDLSKLSNLGYDLNLQKVNISSLIQDSIEDCIKLYLGNKEIEFLVNIDPDVVMTCDPYYLKQTMDNLIINAINYSENGIITVSLKRTDDNILCSIEDEGVGIPENELSDIFEPFSISSRTYTPAGGRGIGLALCKKVISVHGGQIWAQNRRKKRGTIFAFTLNHDIVRN